MKESVTERLLTKSVDEKIVLCLIDTAATDNVKIGYLRESVNHTQELDFLTRYPLFVKGAKDVVCPANTINTCKDFENVEMLPICSVSVTTSFLKTNVDLKDVINKSPTKRES